MFWKSKNLTPRKSLGEILGVFDQTVVELTEYVAASRMEEEILTQQKSEIEIELAAIDENIKKATSVSEKISNLIN